MKSSTSRALFRSVLLVASLVLFAPAALRAQLEDDEDSDSDPRQVASLSVDIDASSHATVTVLSGLNGVSANDLLPLVERALGCRMQPVKRVIDSKQFAMRECQLLPGRSGFLRSQSIALRELAAELKSRKADALSLSVVLPDTEASEALPRAPQLTMPFSAARLPESVRRHFALTSNYFWSDLNDVPPAIRIQYGYKQATLAKTGAILLGFLLMPVILVSWFGRRALSAPAERAPAVWFSYMRYLGWTLNASLFGWLATVESLHCRELLRFFFSSARLNTGWMTSATHEALFWGAPALVWTGCLVLSRPVQEKLRGIVWTRRELALQAVYSFCGAFLPLALWFGAVAQLTAGASRMAALLFIAGFVALLFAKGKLAKLLGMQPHALTSGDLRDVAFALAGKLGVTLQQVFLIPSGKGRMANAFARTGNTIGFTDYLLTKMTKREVNFVIGHELTHLQKKHPNKLVGIACGVGIGLGTVLGTFRSATASSPYTIYGTAILLSTIVTYFFSRRFEYEADAGAVAATGDPQAAICALFKLADLNMHPLQWSSWSEKWLTHPSMTRRAKAIAKRAGIPEESIPTIASQQLLPAVHYPLPTETQLKAKVLSTTHKARSLQSLVFLLLGVALVPPAAFAFLVEKIVPLQAYRYEIYAASIAVAVGLHLWLSNSISKNRLQPLNERVRAKLQQAGIQVDGWSGIPVGFAPADRPRVYEGLTHWDMGFLFLRSDRICYVGDETAFALRYDQISDLRLGPGSPSWIRNERIYLAWKDEAQQRTGVFSIASARPESGTKLRALTSELFRDLNRWRNAKAASRSLPEELAKLDIPQTGAVTAQAPGAALKGGKLLNELFLVGVFAVIVAALFGLPFHLMAFLTRMPARGHAAFSGAGAGWYAVAAGLAIRIFQIAPLFRYKDVPVLAPPTLTDNPTSVAKATVPAARVHQMEESPLAKS